MDSRDASDLILWRPNEICTRYYFNSKTELLCVSNKMLLIHEIPKWNKSIRLPYGFVHGACRLILGTSGLGSKTDKTFSVIPK